MAATRYTNTSLARVPSEGGATRVAIASNVGQGNGGTSLPCRRVFVQSHVSNVGFVRMNIGAAATSVLGLTLPGGFIATITAVISTATNPPALEVPIDDVSKLYFWAATDGDAVDILRVE